MGMKLEPLEKHYKDQINNLHGENETVMHICFKELLLPPCQVCKISLAWVTQIYNYWISPLIILILKQLSGWNDTLISKMCLWSLFPMKGLSLTSSVPKLWKLTWVCRGYMWTLCSMGEAAKGNRAHKGLDKQIKRRSKCWLCIYC